ncbi:hypothetical protein HK104_008579 [Borealophlyctis nickersoniae]|nr:hypothetical protein HK104_008579 [Borealophlyctis nickersoniae]
MPTAETLTAAQQTAVDEFKVLASTEIAKLSFEDKWTTLWGVPMQPLPHTDTSTAASQTLLLLKFLRAKDFKTAEAAQMLINTLKWRKEFDTEKLAGEVFPTEFEDLGMVYGKDKSGKPVTYNFYGGNAPAIILKNTEQFLRWRVQLMEKAIEGLNFKEGVETVSQVHDYAGVGLSPDKEMKAVSKKIIAIFQDYYPEFLERKLFLNVPAVMEILFNLFSSFVSKRTREKFILARSRSARGALLEYISPENLPPRYGGFENLSNVPPGTLPRSSAATDATQLTVPARSSKTVEHPVTAGDTVSWQFVTTGLDLEVSCVIRGSGVEQTVVVEAPKRAEMGSGSVKVEKGGVFVLTFGNGYSYFTEKVVFHRVTVTSGGQ